ncbi:MAG TPA: sugar ABC transporter permease [Clostridiales bacterium]|nr:sugar ABC transporter permease [Clostridiales bacterium]
MKRIRIKSETKQALIGLFFITPFMIGTIVCFLYPVIASFLLSFGDTNKEMAGFHINITGFQNYYRAFMEDTSFVPMLLNVLKQTLTQTPLIVIFSLLIAIMLNKVKKLKGFFRVVMLLPFLLGTGEVLNHLTGQGVDKQIISISNSNIIPREFILYLGSDIVKLLDTLFGTIVLVLWSSGVQILLFLSGIQSITPSLYTSARIDGANEYDMFWKITLPMISPILLLNTIYTIVNSFTSKLNPILDYVKQYAFVNSQHGYAAAMGWIYFAFILLIILIVILVLGNYARSSGVKGRKE